MKTNYIYILLVLLLVSNCKKESETPFIPKNYLAEFKSEQSQIFELDTFEFKEVKGKYGTKIMYSRDLFDLKENEKVLLELIELYDLKEILYQNIQTLTTDNKLLETSGVLKIVFTSNGKRLKLRKGKKIIVYPPKGKLKNNDIFISETDSVGTIKWKVTNQDYVSVKVYRGGGIYIHYNVLKDSLTSLKKQLSDIINFEKKAENYFILNDDSWNWINIDKFSNVKKTLNFQLKDSQQKFLGFQTFIIYNNRNSFLIESRYRNNLKFDSIPIDSSTHLIVVAEHKNQIYYDKIKLNEKLNNSEIQLNMKKTTKEELKILFKQ